MTEERWRPVRAGIINVWRYDEEVFQFHRGRLLLRGPNGSGKSMALELLFPLLFDADASPTRLSSGARSRGSLVERLLTGSTHTSRAGFLWAEFALGDRSFTIGTRLRASDATKKLSIDWFTTKLRVGHDLHLLDENRTPLTRARLEETLGLNGTVHDSAEAYREAVRSTLFVGFARAQYDAMINALLALRREKISQDLTPARLSEILTASLPPLDEHEIAEVAEGYEKLDRRKENLRRLADDVDLVGKLARRQRSYARVVFGTVAVEVRSAESQRDQVTRREREAKRQLNEAVTRQSELEQTSKETEQQARDCSSQMDALRNRDAYKEGGSLEQLRQELARQRAARERSEEDTLDRQSDVDDATSAQDQAKERLTLTDVNEQRARMDSDASADLVGATAIMAVAAAATPDEGESLLDAWITGREEQVRRVRRACLTLQERIGDRNRWEEQVEQDQEALDTANEKLRSGNDGVTFARNAYQEDAGAWRRSCVVLEVGGLDLDDPEVFTHSVNERASAQRTSMTVERAGIEVKAGTLRAKRHDLLLERAEVASGRVSEPEAAPWRSSRERAGAPVWRLVDFNPACDTSTRDGVEAALLASGMLDAWIANDGSLQLPEGVSDALLDGGPDAGPGLSLLSVLDVLDDTIVPREVTMRALRSIAVVPDAIGSTAPAAIDATGAFRLGSLTGRGAIAPASFVGAAAQERLRARRLEAIDREVETLSSEIDGLVSCSSQIAERLSELAAEIARIPTGDAIQQALRQVELCAALVGAAEQRLEVSRRKRDDASSAVREAQATVMRIALEHSLPTGEIELHAYLDAVSTFRRQSDAWTRRRRQLETAAAALGEAGDRVNAARDKLSASRGRLEGAVRVERDLATRVGALESTVGVEYREILQRLEELAIEHTNLERDREQCSKKLRELLKNIGRFETEVTTAEENRCQADDNRSRVHARFVAAVTEGIAEDAALDVEIPRLEGVTSVLETSRAISQRIEGLALDDRARDSAQNNLTEALHETKQSLASQVDFTFEQSNHGWWLLRAATDGLRRNVGQLHLALEAEHTAAREELRDSEQRLFDETLTGTVRQAVADRIRRCTELVSRINEQLTVVRTAAASVQVRLRWDVDPEQPEPVKSARSLLLRDPAALSSDERTALYEFFRARLDEVRAGLDGSAGWDTRLREALDYRNWHRFAVEVAHRDWQGFVPATTTRMQRLSTGERSMALHLPMLASITAHYGGAGTNACPRIILLDELFAGVDTANRGQLFGMLVTWDLDAVLTSDHEWCSYASLDGIAIHFLHPAQGSDPVTSTRFVWDGHQRFLSAVE